MRVIFLILLCFNSFFLNAQELWKGAMYGDSVEKILALFPQHEKPSTEAELSKLGSSLKALVVVPINLAKRPFESILYFDENGLYQVIIKSKSVLNDADAKSTEDFLIDALRSKYGNATKTEDPLEAVTESKPFWIQWDINALSITFVPQYENKSIMISYRITVAEQERLDNDAAKKHLEGTSIIQESEKL